MTRENAYDIMSEKKPTPVITRWNNTKCPVCGQPSYSLGGIHPQCAMVQADASRKAQLMSQKKMAAQIKAKTGSAPLALWEKLCPKCGARLPARKIACACGHRFVTS
jgi:ribosomal protein S27AE